MPDNKFSLRQALLSRLRHCDDPLITYSDLVQLLPLPMSPNDVEFHKLLDIISIEADQRNEGLISVIAVNKKGLPGDGFFKMAKSRGRLFKSKQAFFELALTEAKSHHYEEE